MKITFLGTSAGTEPLPGFRHSSVAVETGGRVFWLDTGENCGYAARLAGIDLLATRAIFLSHAHIDHTGGLPMLVWYIRKLNGISSETPRPFDGKRVEVLVAEPLIWEATRAFQIAHGGEQVVDQFHSRAPVDGVVFEDDGVRVIAHHNMHLGSPESGAPWMSFSYRLEAEGKSIVYSGDIAEAADIAPIIGSCDLALIETAHLPLEDVCRLVRDSAGPGCVLGLVHHPKAAMVDMAGRLAAAREILGERVFVATDGMTYNL